MDFNNFTVKLKKRLQTGLPGKEAQKNMAPFHRIESHYQPSPKTAKKSAVLVLLYPENGKVNVVLMQRTFDGSHHSGQISFPGGKTEPSDTSAIHTALRETHEELGIKPETVAIIGKLSPLYIPVSNFSVVPVVGFSNKKPSYRSNHLEVEMVVEPSLTELRNHMGETEISIKEQSVTVPAYFAQNKIIWGATAMMLAELLDITDF